MSLKLKAFSIKIQQNISVKAQGSHHSDWEFLIFNVLLPKKDVKHGDYTHFIFFRSIFYWVCYYSCPNFSPFVLLYPATHALPQAIPTPLFMSMLGSMLGSWDIPPEFLSTTGGCGTFLFWVSTPPTSLDRCDFFNSVVVRLPFNLIPDGSEWWLFYNLIVIWCGCVRRRPMFTYTAILTGSLLLLFNCIFSITIYSPYTLFHLHPPPHN